MVKMAPRDGRGVAVVRVGSSDPNGRYACASLTVAEATTTDDDDDDADVHHPGCLAQQQSCSSIGSSSTAGVPLAACQRVTHTHTLSLSLSLPIQTHTKKKTHTPPMHPPEHPPCHH